MLRLPYTGRLLLSLLSSPPPSGPHARLARGRRTADHRRPTLLRSTSRQSWGFMCDGIFRTPGRCGVMDVHSRVSFWGDMRAWKAGGAVADCREGAERGSWGGGWSHQALRGHSSMCPLGGTCDHSFVQRAPPSAALAAHVLFGAHKWHLIFWRACPGKPLAAEGSR